MHTTPSLVWQQRAGGPLRYFNVFLQQQGNTAALAPGSETTASFDSFEIIQ